jgi:hypothetical protein
MWQYCSITLLILLIVSIIIPRESHEQHLIVQSEYESFNTETVLDEHRRLIFQSKDLYNTKETLNSTQKIDQPGKCANTVPVVVLEMTTKGSSAPLDNILTPDDIASNFSHSMQHKFGILRFKILDLIFQENRPAKVCYYGEHVTYSSVKCLNEEMVSNRNHSYYNGGNGYDIRVVKSNRHAIIWDPVIDNRDGMYIYIYICIYIHI